MEIDFGEGGWWRKCFTLGKCETFEGDRLKNISVFLQMER